MPQMSNAAALAGRVLLAAIFLLEGYAKVNGYAGALAYMQKFGVPGVMLPPAIAVELIGGLLIVVGFQTRLAALVLAVFCLSAAVLFHGHLADKNQALHFWKDLAIAGGFLMIAAHGAGGWSLDARRGW